MNKKLFGVVFVGGLFAFTLVINVYLGKSSQAHGATLSERVTARKAELSTRLDEATKSRLQARCKAAQTVLKNMKERNQKGHENRQQRYAQISSKLNDYVAKLESQSVNTTELKNVLSQYKQKLEKFTTDYGEYTESLDDAIAMDCAADPEGFKATLESLRTIRQQLIADAKDIKSLQPQLVKALANARVALANIQSQNNNGEGTN